jgi:hypothetical protein
MPSWVDLIESKTFGALFVGVVTLATTSVRLGMNDWRSFALALLIVLIYWRLFPAPRGYSAGSEAAVSAPALAPAATLRSATRKTAGRGEP